MRSFVFLSSLVVALTLPTSCAVHSEDPTVPTLSPSRSSETPGDGLQIRKHSGAYDLVLEDVSVVSRGGHDRVVLRFAGTGRPGWSAGFVEEAVVDGSGKKVKLDGDAVLSLSISGTPTLLPARRGSVRSELGGDVVDLHAVEAWEGITQVFLGLRGGRTPFQVSALAGPPRLVVDLE